MADVVDMTADRMEAEEQNLIAASRRPEGPVATGRCLYCDEIVADGQRWCDSVCRDEWAKESKRGRR